MTRKRQIFLGSAVRVAVVVAYFGCALMTAHKQNAHCRTFEEADFQQIKTASSKEVMQTLNDGVPLWLIIETDLPLDGQEILTISLGGLEDLNGVEYKGPLRGEVNLMVGLAADEDSFPAFPSIQILHPARRAACV